MPGPADWELAVLEQPELAEVVSQLVAESEISLNTTESLRRRFGREMAEAILRLATSRRKAAGKMPQSEGLWLDPVRVEQATHQLVANHKARRFRGLAVADICCGVGGDSLALAGEATAVVSVDRDRDALRRLYYNARVLGLESQILLVQGDANRDLIDGRVAVHIDPDRRAADRGGRPSFSLDACQPSLQTLLAYMTAYNGGAIKLSPGSDFELLETKANARGIRTETEIISLSGECREATVWFGQLAGNDPRRATILPGSFGLSGQPEMKGLQAVEAKPGDWLFEVDTAIVRAGLAVKLAKQNQLGALTPDGAWLTGDDECHGIVGSVQRFQVIESTNADRRAVREMLRKIGWGAAVVKTRGRLNASEVHKWLDAKPSGQTALTLIMITLPGKPSKAIAAIRRIS
ncbi:MAG: hypothetical protein ACKO0V_07555 [bacterium]